MLALAVIAALLPLPALADQGQETVTPGIRVSAAAIAKSEPLAARTVPSAQEQGAPGAQSPSFFRRPIGIAALVIFAAGAGYAIYSVQNDRISSPGKK
jgi:hypothetical protein